MRVSLLIAAAVLLSATAGDGIATRGGRGTREAAGTVIEAAPGRCGAGWAAPRAGPQTLLLRNGGAGVADVTLVDPASGAVYAEIEGLAPGTARPMRVRLGAGEYAFRCAGEGASDAVTGPPARIGGPRGGGPAIVPVGENDLYGPARTYRAQVVRGLDRLVARTGALRAAVHGGDRDAARAAWTPAHLAYERLGAAYGAFGDLDGAVNGLPGGLAGGVRDPGFTGFHRLEHGLWHGEALPALEPVADRLARDVRALRKEFAEARVEPGDLPLRAHEILEDTLRFQLTGAADLGSGTELRTAAANLAGTRAVLAALRPLLRPRFAALPELDAWLDRLAARLAGRSSLGALTALQRADLDGTAGRAAELLASVATILAPRRTGEPR